MTIKCGSCKFFDMVDNIQGKCHRHAPRPTIVRGGEKDTYIVVLPIMKIEDYCGEFAPAEMPNVKSISSRSANA